MTKADTQSKTRPGSEFNLHFHPFSGRVYRTALLLTQSPQAAKHLAGEIYTCARRKYEQRLGTSDFRQWLAYTIHSNFVSETTYPTSC